MPTYYVKAIIDGQPTFEKPLAEILSDCKKGGGVKILTPAQYITDQQRRWFKGVCLPKLVKDDENGETNEWWDTEVKKRCNGLAYLKKEVFFIEDVAGGKVGVGRLTTKGVGVKNMRNFIEEILSKAAGFGWDISAPDPELRN